MGFTRYMLLVIFGVVIVVAMVVVLAVENVAVFTVSERLSLLAWRLPPMPLWLLLLASCLLGASLLYVVAVVSALQERRELHMLRKKVAEFERAQASMPGTPQQLSPSLIVPMPGIRSPGPLPPYPPQS